MVDQTSKKALFLELAKPNEKGISREVKVVEFIGRYERLKMGNGGDWCRSDGSLAKEFIVRRVKEKGAIVSVKLNGFNTKAQIDKNIKAEIKKDIQSQKCVVLAISDVEVDHKDGHLDDYSNFDVKNQSLDQFQPLSSAVNKAKRTHCKICRETGTRFDATVLGYSIGQWVANGTYEKTCVGCYWYDIKEFNAEVSKNYIKQ